MASFKKRKIIPKIEKPYENIDMYICVYDERKLINRIEKG